MKYGEMRKFRQRAQCKMLAAISRREYRKRERLHIREILQELEDDDIQAAREFREYWQDVIGLDDPS